MTDLPTNVNKMLPFNRDQSVAKIGRHAHVTIDMGGGSAQVNPPYRISVVEGLTAQRAPWPRWSMSSRSEAARWWLRVPTLSRTPESGGRA
jgi:Glycosyl hydrolase family 3 C-terminal domain